MTAREDEAQQVVADVVVELGVEVRRLALHAEVARDLRVLVLECLAASHEVDRPVLRRRGQPRPGVRRDAGRRPALQRDDERILGQVLGQADVAHHARDGRDHARRLDPPDRVDLRAGSLRLRRRHPGYSATGLLGRFLRQLGRVCDLGRVVRRLGDLPHLDRAVADRRARGPLDGLLLRARLDDPVAADELLGLGERPVRDRRPVAAREVSRVAVDGGCSPSSARSAPALASSSLYLFIACDELERRALVGLARIDEQHEAHRRECTPPRTRCPRRRDACSLLGAGVMRRASMPPPSTVASVIRRSCCSAASRKSRMPLPRTIGDTSSTYSSTRSWSMSVWTSVGLPQTSTFCSSRSARTRSITSSATIVELFQSARSSVRRHDVLGHRVELVRERVARAGRPRRGEALVGDAAEQHRVGVAQDGVVELAGVVALELAGPQVRVLDDVVERDEAGDGELAHGVLLGGG